MDDLSSFKLNYVGKEYYFLTVNDVEQIDGKIKLKCTCRCGKIHYIDVKKFGKTKSCGCYQKSDEYKQIRKAWNAAHKQELIEKGKRYSQWCKDNPDKFNKRNENLRKSWTDDKRKKFSNTCKEYYENNQDAKDNIKNRVQDWWDNMSNDELNQIITQHKQAKLKTRLSYISEEFISDLHPDYIEKLNCGEIKVNSIVETKCHVCDNYDKHSFNNVYHLKSREYTPRMCCKCYKSFSTSKYEQEISDFISTFYNGELIRNSRDIISPLELDLYYSEKKIAIEFNGDYWHDENHKSRDYHYNKFKQCYDKGILLVSIFESDWINNSDLIKIYLHDLFNNIENNLSYNNNYMNNNYPSPNKRHITGYIPSCYTINENVVYTCGYSKLADAYRV